MREPRRIAGRGLLAVILFAWALVGGGRPACAAEAKHIILMIADGTGYNSLEAASYYQYGGQGQQAYERPGWVGYGCGTSALSRAGQPSGVEEQDGEIEYDTTKAWDKGDEAVVDRNNDLRGAGAFKGYNFLKTTYTDSAAAASALATGVKTYNMAIGYANAPEKTGTSLIRRTVAELGKMRGLSTGVVTSVPWSHATPAAIGGVHNLSRDHYFAIANEMLDSRHLDVIMGAGHPEYDNDGAPRQPGKKSDYDYVGGPESWERLVEGKHAWGWALVQTKAEFEALMTGGTPAKVLGTAQVGSTLQQGRRTRDWDGDGYVEEKDKRVSPAYGDPLVGTVPTLATMTRGALNVLHRRGTGFFLMVEGGAVDWANHANQGGRMIEEAIEFTEAIRVVSAWVETYSNWEETLVMVTADHETGLLWGPRSDKIAFDAIVNNGVGKMPGMRFNTGSHTNSLVPLWARGVGAELFERRLVGYDPRRGAYVGNTEIPGVIKRVLPGALRKGGDSVRPGRGRRGGRSG